MLMVKELFVQEEISLIYIQNEKKEILNSVKNSGEMNIGLMQKSMSTLSQS